MGEYPEAAKIASDAIQVDVSQWDYLQCRMGPAQWHEDVLLGISLRRKLDEARWKNQRPENGDSGVDQTNRVHAFNRQFRKRSDG